MQAAKGCFFVSVVCQNTALCAVQVKWANYWSWSFGLGRNCVFACVDRRACAWEFGRDNDQAYRQWRCLDRQCLESWTCGRRYNQMCCHRSLCKTKGAEAPFAFFL